MFLVAKLLLTLVQQWIVANVTDVESSTSVGVFEKRLGLIYLIGKSQKVWKRGREEVGVGVCRDIYYILVADRGGCQPGSLLLPSVKTARKK